jgi:1-acyl-sn-glycerol-3-phosphate acyltransferase
MSAPDQHDPAHRAGERMSRTQRRCYAVVRAAIALVSKLWFRVEVHGRENVPVHGPFVVAPNHRSNLDTPVIGVITRRVMRYMGKDSLWDSRPLGWFLTALGGFPVHRGTADREALRAGLACIERGEPLVMFPEGTRQSGPVLAEMFDGPAYVACRTGAPILPVGMSGTEAAMPRGAKLIRPVKVRIVIGEPLVPPPLGERGRVSRRAVRDLTAQLGVALQRLFDEARGEPGR